MQTRGISNRQRHVLNEFVNQFTYREKFTSHLKEKSNIKFRFKFQKRLTVQMF